MATVSCVPTFSIHSNNISHFLQQNIPCQFNSYDCGIFSLEVKFI